MSRQTRGPKPHQPNFNNNKNRKFNNNNSNNKTKNNKSKNNNYNKNTSASNFAAHGLGQLRFSANNACSLNKDKKDELIAT
jgi:phosphoribosylformylglycinamidine (FGAM) synthase-like amidotransferase family enzyme